MQSLPKYLIISTLILAIPSGAMANAFGKSKARSVAAFTQIKPPVFRSIDEFLTCVDQNSQVERSKTNAAEKCENAAKMSQRLPNIKRPI